MQISRWSHMKDKVYETNFLAIQALKRNISTAIEVIPTTFPSKTSSKRCPSVEFVQNLHNEHIPEIISHKYCYSLLERNKVSGKIQNRLCFIRKKHRSRRFGTSCSAKQQKLTVNARKVSDIDLIRFII